MVLRMSNECPHLTVTALTKPSRNTPRSSTDVVMNHGGSSRWLTSGRQRADHRRCHSTRNPDVSVFVDDVQTVRPHAGGGLGSCTRSRQRWAPRFFYRDHQAMVSVGMLPVTARLTRARNSGRSGHLPNQRVRDRRSDSGIHSPNRGYPFRVIERDWYSWRHAKCGDYQGKELSPFLYPPKRSQNQ